MTNDEGMTKINSQKLSGLRMAQRLGACIISTAIMLPRNTSRTIAKPIKIPLRSGSFCCFWRRNGETLVKSAGAALNSAGLALISSRWGSGRDPLASDSKRASVAPNRIRSSKLSSVSVTGLPLTCVPLVEPRSFNRYVSPANCKCACRAETEGLLIIMVLSGPRPIVIRLSTSSYVVPLIVSFGILEIIYPDIWHVVERFFRSGSNGIEHHDSLAFDARSRQP